MPHQYVAYFNTARPHQGLQQRIPDGAEVRVWPADTGRAVRAVPVLGDFTTRTSEWREPASRAHG